MRDTFSEFRLLNGAARAKKEEKEEEEEKECFK